MRRTFNIHISSLSRTCCLQLRCMSSIRDHMCPLLSALHWLSVDPRIWYKTSTFCCDVISGSAPPCLSDLLQLYIPSRTLRSSADTRSFRVPHLHKKFQEQRAFSYIGPVTRNSLPFAVRHSQTLPSFKSQLKTRFCQSK